MRDIGAVKPDDRVLVSGAAGGVGQIAEQIAQDWQVNRCRDASGQLADENKASC